MRRHEVATWVLRDLKRRTAHATRTQQTKPYTAGWGRTPASWGLTDADKWIPNSTTPGEPPSVSATADALTVLDLAHAAFPSEKDLKPVKRYIVAELDAAAEGECDAEHAVHRLASGIRAMHSYRYLRTTTAERAAVARAVEALNGDSGPARSGGWGNALGAERGALLPTYHAVWALNLALNNRVASDDSDSPRASAMRFLAQISSVTKDGGRRSRYWKTNSMADHPSPAHTALAVLCLWHSDRQVDRRIATEGAHWLWEHHEQWTSVEEGWEQVAAEQAVVGFESKYPNLALCSLACVMCWEEKGPNRLSLDGDAPRIPRLRSVLANLDGLWTPGAAQSSWSPQPNLPPQMATRRIVLALDRALLRRNVSWDQVLASGDPDSSPRSSSWTDDWNPKSGCLEISCGSGPPVEVQIHAQRWVLDALYADDDERSLDRSALFRRAGLEQAETSTDPQRLREKLVKHVEEINRTVERALAGQGLATPGRLIGFERHVGRFEPSTRVPKATISRAWPSSGVSDAHLDSELPSADVEPVEPLSPVGAPSD